VSNRAFSKGLVPHVCHAPKNFELPRRAGPHLLDRLLDRVQRRGIGVTGHVVTQNPAGGEEPGEMPRAGARTITLRFRPGPPIMVEKLL